MLHRDVVGFLNLPQLVDLDDVGVVEVHPDTRFVANFLGKTNLFQGDVGQSKMRLGNLSWATPDATPDGPVTIAVRPEKIALADDGLPAKVSARTFQGGQWLWPILLPPVAALANATYATEVAFFRAHPADDAGSTAVCALLDHNAHRICHKTLRARTWGTAIE